MKASQSKKVFSASNLLLLFIKIYPVELFSSLNIWSNSESEMLKYFFWAALGQLIADPARLLAQPVARAPPALHSFRDYE